MQRIEVGTISNRLEARKIYRGKMKVVESKIAKLEAGSIVEE